MHDVTLVILNSLRIKCRVRRSLRIYSPRRNMNIYSRSVPLKNSNLLHNLIFLCQGMFSTKLFSISRHPTTVEEDFSKMLTNIFRTKTI